MPHTMKKIFGLTRKKKYPSSTPDSGSVLSVGYEVKEKDLSKVHKAAFAGDVAKLKQLVKKNDINQLDKENRTALHIACASGHVDVVQFLVESKAKLNLCDNQNRSALMKAVQGQHERCVNILLENHAEPNLVDINGNTALHLAANIPAISTAMLLVEHEADINAQNKEGFTPLAVSVREEHIEMAEFLLKEGADVNFTDKDQRSPLMLAAGNGQICMLQLLLRFDANITLKDTKGWSSDDYAVMNGHHPCSLLITEHGTKRNAMSLSQVSSKKKKAMLGSPSQEVEAGFSLGGPATDKDDAEDNSQSESLSRVSKSAGDDWPSSGDDDESHLISKKAPKVNLRKLIASKKGEATPQPDRPLGGTDSEPESEDRVQRIPSLPKALPFNRALQHPIAPSPASFSKAPQRPSTLLPKSSMRKSRPSELPSSSKTRSDSQEGSPESDESEQEEEEEDEEEDDDDDEEEDDDDEEEEEEEEEESEEDEGDDEENQEEHECEEDDDNCVGSISVNTTGFEDVLKLSVTSALNISIDTQNIPATDISCNKVTNPSHIGIAENEKAPENADKTETQRNDNISTAETSQFGMPVTLDIEGDCVVSAIRVEAKYSDEDDSFGKEWSSDQNRISDLGSTAGLITSRRNTANVSPSKTNEEDFARAKEMDDDDHGDLDTNSCCDKQDNSYTMWNDSDNDEVNQTVGFRQNTVLNRNNIVSEDEVEKSPVSPCDEDDGLKKEAFEFKKRRSSWGSSLDENDSDQCGSPRDDEVNMDMLEQKGNAQTSDLLLKGATKSTSPQPIENPLDSSWDSSSPVIPSTEDKPVVDEPVSSLKLCSSSTSQPRNRSAKAKADECKSDWDCSSENQDGNDCCPFTKDEVLDVTDSQLKGKLDCQSRNEDSWEDDDDGIDEPKNPISLIQKQVERPLRKYAPTAFSIRQETKVDEVADYGEADVKRGEEVALTVNDKNDESSVDNRLEEELFVDQSNSEFKPQSSAYVPFCRKCDTVPQTTVPLDDLDENSVRELKLSSPPTKDDVTDAQHRDSNCKRFSDEELPQTDIDDVDIDSPAETESMGKRSSELRNTEERVIQHEDSTLDEDDDDDGEEEEDLTDEKDETDEDGDSPVPPTPDYEKDVYKDNKRDFLSELGLEKGGEEQDSLDSESLSADPAKPHDGNLSSHTQEAQEEMSTVEEEIKKAAAGNSGNDNGEEHVSKDAAMAKESERAKWEPLSVLSKLEGENEQKTDLMEELGLGDVDDLEDASDWDSASTASKRTLPGCRMVSPGFEEHPECSTPSVQEEEISSAAPPTTHKHMDSGKGLPSTPPQTIPHPQPRARKMFPQKQESDDESDLESDNLTSSFTAAKTGNQLSNAAEHLAVVRPGSPKRSLMARDNENNMESDEQLQEEKDDAEDTGKVGLNNPCLSGRVGSDSEEQNDELGNQQNLENRGELVDGVPWEKRYEKLWVAVEKKEAKSTFKNVAGELKEKFGELLRSKTHTAEDITEDEQDRAESAFPEEASSDEEEGDVIVRPTAMARRTVLLTIPEQRESGLEDTVTESTDNSECEDRRKLCEISTAHNPDLLPDDVLEEYRSPSPQLQTGVYNAESECITDNTAKDFPDKPDIPASDFDHNRYLNDGMKLEPVHTPQLQLCLKDNTVEVDEAEKSHTRSERDPDEFSHFQPHSLSIHSAAIPGVSDEEMEEDMEKLKLEVDQERTKTAIEVQISSVSWNPGGTVLEGVRTEKPETRLECQKELSSQSRATQKGQQPTATGSAVQTLGSKSPKSTNGAPVQLQRTLQQTSNFKQEGEAVAVEETSLVRGARRSRAPQTNIHVNGDPLSVFDDSTLSEVSDDDGRLSSGDQHKHENPGEMEMAEDFDELTQSSDTATDDIDSPTSGYRHASVLIQKLDSTTLDPRSMVKLQNIFHEYQRSIQKSRSRNGYLTDKVTQMEMERSESKSSLEEIKDIKSALERNQLELQTDVTNLKFQLKQEQENRRNATMMYNTTRDKLRRIEEHQQVEVQERQKVELTLRNLELEKRTLVNNMKQLEEDHSETQRLLAQERSARTLQENLLNSHLRKQQEIEQENKRHLSKSNEALSQLTEASDREKELLHQSAALKEELSILRSDLERSQANCRLKESHLMEENEVLKEQLEDARRDLKLNSEALAQAAFNYNSQLTALKSELSVTTTRLENERQARETADAEVEIARNRHVGSIQEAERCLADKADTERTLLREKEEHQRLKDKLKGEAASQRETVSSLSQRLAKAEAHANSLENEVHRATLQLTEKGLLLEVLQREKDQAAARAKELETALQAERELVSRAGARQEATHERLAQAQSEGMLLRQQLEEVQNKGVAKERAVTDAQERFSDILSKLRSDCEERVQLVEEKSKELASKAADLRDQVYKLEEEKNEKETGLRQLQQELADSLKKLSMSEATLEVNTRYRNDLEEEKARHHKEMDRLREKLQESEDQYVQSERRINSLKSSVDEKERELSTAAQKLQEALSTSAGSETTIKQLEDAVQRLEIENARLEAAAKQQANKIDALQKGAQEAAMVRSHLEDLITNLQSSKMTLEDQLNQEVQKQSMLSHTAQDSQALWEEELKSRSKLGLRLAELEKEKGELNTQMEIERMKAKKMAEQKSTIDSRLDQEMKRNTELQKEMYRLRSLLKTAKKKLQDQDSGGAEFGSSRSRMEMSRHSQAEGGFGRMQEKVDDLQDQMKKEASHCSQLEKLNRELKEELASLKSHSNDQLERNKRQLEEEIVAAQRQMESQAEQYRREADERVRQEILQKLEQVNLFLQSQAASQEALDQVKAANEANLRSQLEQVTQEFEKERGRSRKSEQDSFSLRDSTRTELDRYHQLYTEEIHLRKSLAAKLDRANSRLAEANSKLLNERSKPFITSSFANASLGGPSLGVGSLGSMTNYGATLGPLNRSSGLGLSTEGQSSRADDFLCEMRDELAKAISRELSKAKAELDCGSAYMLPGSLGVELDPLARAKKDYLEVLKKNYSI